MGFKYAVAHTVVHLLLALLLYLIFRPGLAGLAAILLGTVLIDLDHLSLWFQHGIRGYLYLRAVIEVGKARRFYLHNLVTLIASFVASLAVGFALPKFFLFELFFLATTLHLGWDLFEDVVIFKMGVKHWMIRR